jgi:hypothetical protein
MSGLQPSVACGLLSWALPHAGICRAFGPEVRMRVSMLGDNVWAGREADSSALLRNDKG